MSREERKKVYKEGYEQGRFDERMDSIDNRPPTEKEVCEALSEYLGREVVFIKDVNKFAFNGFDGYEEICFFNGKLLRFTQYLPPRIITLIGRFYEKESERE
jgi:hypothetical protein